MLDFKTTLTRGERYVFAAILPAFFALAGWFLARRTGLAWAGWALFLSAVTISLLGLVWPPILRGVFVVWMALVFPVGWLMSNLILVFIYYLVITPVALLMKLVRFDPLHRDRDPQASSYWEPRKPVPNIKRYFRQF